MQQHLNGPKFMKEGTSQHETYPCTPPGQRGCSKSKGLHAANEHARKLMQQPLRPADRLLFVSAVSSSMLQSQMICSISFLICQLACHTIACHNSMSFQLQQDDAASLKRSSLLLLRPLAFRLSCCPWECQQADAASLKDMI